MWNTTVIKDQYEIHLYKTDGKDIKLNQTTNEHYCISISKKNRTLWMTSGSKSSVNVKWNIDKLDEKSGEEKKDIAINLHKQFGHLVDSNKLKCLACEAHIDDKDGCNTCNRYRRALAHPVVSFPLGKEFNNIVALDLKFVWQEVNVKRKRRGHCKPNYKTLDYNICFSSLWLCDASRSWYLKVCEELINVWVKVSIFDMRCFTGDTKENYMLSCGWFLLCR